MAIVHTGIVDGFRTLKDNTLKMSFAFLELSSEEMGQLMKCNNQHVKIIISSANIDQGLISQLDNIEVKIDDKKSPSQRMRNVLYRLWEQNNKGHDDFDLYYISEMNKITEWLKQKLV